MNILKRYESDDFDESFDFDEPENGEFEETGSSKPFLVKALIMNHLLQANSHWTQSSLKM